MQIETAIRRRTPIFEGVVRTSVPHGVLVESLAEALTPDPRFDAIKAFGYRYSGQMNGESFWLRRTAAGFGDDDSAVVHGRLISSAAGTEIELTTRWSRRALSYAVTGLLAAVFGILLQTPWAGAIALAAAVFLIIELVDIWRRGAQTLRDVASLLISPNRSGLSG